MTTRTPFAVVLGASLALAATACDDRRSVPSAPDADPALSVTESRPGTRVYQFRTVEDPEVLGAVDVCKSAPFTPNVYLNASVYVENVRASDGMVVAERADPVGTALACAQITDFSFPPGKQQNFYAQFNLPSVSVIASGTCTLISNDVPVTHLVLAGCTLRVVRAPEGFVGGAATSLSVFNPFRLAGYSTGSRWTIQLYEPAT
jgi:hypothetical protein